MLDHLFIYFPSPWVERDWAALSGLPLHELMIPVSSHVRVHGWLVVASATAPILLWCHGNAGNMTHRLDQIAEFYRRGLTVCIFDYRGYGKSTGRPTEPGLYEDAIAVYDFLVQHRHIRADRLVLFGRSLGAAVAGKLATMRSAAGLILEGAFPSIQAMADYHYWGFPARWVVDARFPLVDYAGQISIPTLVIHGERDAVVPMALGRKVYEAVQGPKEWWVVPGADHNTVPVVGGDRYYERVLNFVRRVIR
ncbi:MAG: alpha/beta hydrolase [Nitrospirae bacterium]|nr:MAG: alpha/beta hydrolase [Nitrospirota bacterium]